MTNTMARACLLLAAAILLLSGCAGPTTTGPTPVPPAQPAPSLPADLPLDADRSDVSRQLALLRRGLYLTRAGEVRALPAKYAKASWSAGRKAPAPEKADQQTEERIRILLEERRTE